MSCSPRSTGRRSRRATSRCGSCRTWARRELVDPALMDGLVQLVPEYAGSALEFFSLGRLSATSDAGAANRALARSAAGRGLVAARPAPAQDANAIVVTAATAARYGLRSIADLAKVAPRLVFGGPPECPERAYCLPGLRRAYGLRFKAFIPLDAGGPLTLQALEAGAHRRRAAVHHRPGHPGAAPGHPGRRPRAAAGREHHPPGTQGRHRPLRPQPGRAAQQDLGSAGHRHAARPRRAGRAGRAWTSLGGQGLAARTRADPGKGRCALSEHIGRAVAGNEPGHRATGPGRPQGPPSAPPDRRAAAAAAPGHHHHDGVAGPGGHSPRRRVPGRAAHAVAPDRRSVQYLGPSLAGGDADAVADRCGQRDQRGGLRLGGHRARPVAGRPDDGVPALAAPAGVPGQRVVPGVFREVALFRAVPAAPVRRADHRQLGRVLRGGPPGGGRDDLLDGCRLLPGRAGPRPHLDQGGGGRRGRRVRSRPPVPGPRSPG